MKPSEPLMMREQAFITELTLDSTKRFFNI
jgi:hypothetical protein